MFVSPKCMVFVLRVIIIRDCAKTRILLYGPLVAG